MMKSTGWHGNCYYLSQRRNVRQQSQSTGSCSAKTPTRLRKIVGKVIASVIETTAKGNVQSESSRRKINETNFHGRLLLLSVSVLADWTYSTYLGGF
jgi:hypothetical protein